MTKKEVAIIKAKESALWTELQEARRDYVKAHFPAGYGYIKAENTEYIRMDANLSSLLDIWAIVAGLMEDLRIESDHNEEAEIASTDMWEYLEGRGKYAPEEEEEEEEEEVTEEPDETATVYAKTNGSLFEWYHVASYVKSIALEIVPTSEYRDALVKCGFAEPLVIIATDDRTGEIIAENNPDEF